VFGNASVKTAAWQFLAHFFGFFFPLALSHENTLFYLGF
jgi:hypothetical protein